MLYFLYSFVRHLYVSVRKDLCADSFFSVASVPSRTFRPWWTTARWATTTAKTDDRRSWEAARPRSGTETTTRTSPSATPKGDSLYVETLTHHSNLFYFIFSLNTFFFTTRIFYFLVFNDNVINPFPLVAVLCCVTYILCMCCRWWSTWMTRMSGGNASTSEVFAFLPGITLAPQLPQEICRVGCTTFSTGTYCKHYLQISWSFQLIIFQITTTSSLWSSTSSW